MEVSSFGEVFHFSHTQDLGTDTTSYDVSMIFGSLDFFNFGSRPSSKSLTPRTPPTFKLTNHNCDNDRSKEKLNTLATNEDGCMYFTERSHLKAHLICKVNE